MITLADIPHIVRTTYHNNVLKPGYVEKMLDRLLMVWYIHDGRIAHKFDEGELQDYVQELRLEANDMQIPFYDFLGRKAQDIIAELERSETKR